MTHILTIETNNSTHFEQIKKLAQKLGVATTEGYEKALSAPGVTAKGKADVERYLAYRRNNPPVKVPKDFDFNMVVDS